MPQTRKAIGIFGGTFDPIHYGHLRLALEMYESLELAKVHIIPCFQPVHREMPAASSKQRLAMVERAVSNESTLVADAREIKREGPSYMIDTLLELRQEMPTTPLCLFIGIDSFLGFLSWHRWQEILEHAHLVIAHRLHYQLPNTGMIAELIHERLQHDQSYLHENLSGGIIIRPITSLDISATEIRKQIATGKNPRFLLPDSVYELINQQGIYSKR